MTLSRTTRRRVERVIGPLGALLLHLLLLLLVLLLFHLPPPAQTEVFEVHYIQEPAPPPLTPRPPDVEDPWPAEPPMPIVPEESSPGPTAEEVLAEVAELPALPAPDLECAFQSAPLVIHLAQPQRIGPARARAVETYGQPASGDTEGAVLRALSWLRSNQQSDGSWGFRPVAMTGLALLTFLAHGETPASTEFGACVERGMRFLLGRQELDGRFVDTGSEQGAYEQAIATYAAAEAFALTRVPTLRTAMDRAVGVLVAGQSPEGSWTYRYARDGRRDTSLAGWHIQALKAAKAAGSGTPGLDEALRRAVADLRRAHDAQTGRFWDSLPGGHASPGVTAAAVLCLQLTGHGRVREARGGLRALRGHACDWSDPPPWALYTWYYQTQALFQAGGSAWQKWNRAMAQTLTAHQNPDGSWTAPGQARKGGGREVNYGLVYSTTLAALALEVYYRLLPSYEAPAHPEPEEKAGADEVVVEVI